MSSRAGKEGHPRTPPRARNPGGVNGMRERHACGACEGSRMRVRGGIRNDGAMMSKARDMASDRAQ